MIYVHPRPLRCLLGEHSRHVAKIDSTIYSLTKKRRRLCSFRPMSVRQGGSVLRIKCKRWLILTWLKFSSLSHLMFLIRRIQHELIIKLTAKVQLIISRGLKKRQPCSLKENVNLVLLRKIN